MDDVRINLILVSLQFSILFFMKIITNKLKEILNIGENYDLLPTVVGRVEDCVFNLIAPSRLVVVTFSEAIKFRFSDDKGFWDEINGYYWYSKEHSDEYINS